MTISDFLAKRTTTTADPCGMTNKKDKQKQQQDERTGNGYGKSNDKDECGDPSLRSG
jgi:hypothetical protein